MTYSTEQSALCSRRVRSLTPDRQSSDGLTYANLYRTKRHDHILAEFLEDCVDIWLQFEIVVLQITIW